VKCFFFKENPFLYLPTIYTLILTDNPPILLSMDTSMAAEGKLGHAELTPTTSVTSTVISPVKMSIGRKLFTNLHSEMISVAAKGKVVQAVHE
jgi:hypothetical protein